MLKIYDWECVKCGARSEHFITVERGRTPPSWLRFLCSCGGRPEHRRLVSMPARYLGDKPVTTCVYGGNSDTAGFRAVPAYPELRDGVRFEKREAPDGSLRNTKIVKASALMEHQNSVEWREVHKAREAICDENAAKLSRLPALKAGKISLRDTKLPGDPSLTTKRKVVSNG